MIYQFAPRYLFLPVLLWTGLSLMIHSYYSTSKQIREAGEVRAFTLPEQYHWFSLCMAILGLMIVPYSYIKEGTYILADWLFWLYIAETLLGVGGAVWVLTHFKKEEVSN